MKSRMNFYEMSTQQNKRKKLVSKFIQNKNVHKIKYS